MVLPALHDLLVRKQSWRTTVRTSNGHQRREAWSRKCHSKGNFNDDVAVFKQIQSLGGSRRTSVEQFSDPDEHVCTYSYSVGPFAHSKSEGKSSRSGTTWVIEDFIPLSATLLGSGKFGSVNLCHTPPLGRVALKKFDKSTRQDQSLWKREVEIQTSLSHNCILPSFGYFQTKTALYIVMEYCSGGDLVHFLNHYKIAQQDCKIIISQISSALAYLQQHRIAHRDVKTENVLVTSKKPLQTKLADFGYAVHCPDSDLRSTLCGTLACLPPEMLATPPLHYHALMVDSWSLGILAYELVLEEPVFTWPGNSQDMKAKIRNYKDEILRMPTPLSAFASFVCSLLARDPSARMTPYQALGHSWLSSESSDLKPSALRKQSKRQRCK